MAWTDNLFRWLGFGRYNSTLPTVAEGQVEELQVDSRGRLRVAIEAAVAAFAARYSAAPASVADGELVDVLADEKGRIRVWVERGNVDLAGDVRPPSGASAPTADQRLAGTGTTEATNATALTSGAMATLKVGAVAVRVAFLGSAGGGSAVVATDLALSPYDRIDWIVQSGKDAHVAIEAADGTSAYEAWVWTSSGARA